MRIRPALAAEWAREQDWLDALPDLVHVCREQWGLELQEPVDTPHSLVVPARDVVLKLNAPSHFEADDEADALEAWRGVGADRLVARDDARRALLIERCRPGTRVSDSDVDEQQVVAGLIQQPSHAAPTEHPFPLLTDEARRWAKVLTERYEQGGRPFERRLLDEALAVLRSTDGSARALVNQDLHGANILRADRAPWLVIDPKPLVGEPELDGVGLLRNAPFGGQSVERWLDALSELSRDRERLRGWGVEHTLAWAWDERRGWSSALVDAAHVF